jgi:hypothetical protein
MPKVSIIVPIYNVEKYLARCLDSLKDQTLQDIEVILVNDGSTDNSGNIAKEYANKYENFVYKEKANGGLSDARNYGLKFATGDYIAFLDSDDYVDVTTYEKMLKKAEKEQADYVECDFIWEYPNKIKIDKQIPYNNKKEMLCLVRVVAWNKLIKRKIIEENNIEFPKGLRYEDVEFTYKLLPLLEKCSYVAEPLIHYTQRENSIANVQNEKTADIFIILDDVISYYKEKNIYEEYKEELEYNYARYLLCSSLKRICKIKDKSKRKELIEKTWKNLNSKFPNWKKNKFLVENSSNKNKYMRTINKFTYNIYTKIFSLL